MYFVTTEWPGGIYASPTIAGSRPGALIAACWASLMHMGEEGYMNAAREITETQRKIKQAIVEMDGIRLVGDSHTMVVSFTGEDGLNPFMVSDVMSKKGWNLNALQKPNSVHLCCTYKHVGKADEFIADLREAVALVKKDPSAYKEGAARVYGLAHGLPDRSIVKDIVSGFLDACLRA